MIYLKKSTSEPEELAVERAKSSGDYAIPSVLMKLKDEFKDKCYICEYKNPTTINVEHFVSHQGNHNLKFDWENLFLACSHCNNIKRNHYDNMLNCTKVEDDVENAIKFHIDPIPFKEVEVSPLVQNEKVFQTVDLLNKVYNGTTTMKKIESNYIRQALVEEMLLFFENLTKYFKAGTPALQEFIKLQIGEQLDSSSPFTIFKRWVIKDTPKLMEEFGSFITSSHQIVNEARTS
ncbi:hypothetical protein CN556_24885 [Bacillus wiedmannii]|uniref:HNH endonuclease signature motif containing protein n=1 Tax=Bacillus wiedmannii TaxID=1890302 RepID=UPI000BEDF045|nr:HNH endonuclease signature motif containing protein [Bacillus wiedmannii]PEC58439.1 hypothetical protein CON91_27925 [Bacillus wiedmannii]PEI34210.1 hypothetical protein CN644_18345 [Bacillus wiedmannii]PEN91891.1 hypothetical protein CN556_24885 [Bacillus wiedmannii]